MLSGEWIRISNPTKSNEIGYEEVTNMSVRCMYNRREKRKTMRIF